MFRRLGISTAAVRVTSITAVLVALAACSDQSTLITGTGVPSAPPTLPPSGLGVVEASVDAQGNLTITPLGGGQTGTGYAPGIDANNIYGTQNVNVRVYAAAATVTTSGGTKTWTMNFGVRNYLPYPVGSSQAGPTPTDTTGIFLAMVVGPTVTKTSSRCTGTCAVNVTVYDGMGNFTGPNQPFLYWRQRLAAKQTPAGADTVSQRRTFRFTSPTQVTNFNFYMLVGADWPPPAETNWSLYYNAATDSGAGIAAKPRWKKGSQSFLGTGTETWSKSAGTDAVQATTYQDLFLYRRDSLAAATPAYMEAQLTVASNSNNSQPGVMLGFLDGSKMAAIGMTRSTVGFVQTSTSVFGFGPPAPAFVGSTYSVNTTQRHIYRIRKFGTDSVTLEVDGTRRVKVNYSQLPGSGSIPTFTTGPAEFFGATGAGSTTASASWNYVTYGIGSTQP